MSWADLGRMIIHFIQKLQLSITMYFDGTSTLHTSGSGGNYTWYAGFDPLVSLAFSVLSLVEDPYSEAITEHMLFLSSSTWTVWKCRVDTHVRCASVCLCVVHFGCLKARWEPGPISFTSVCCFLSATRNAMSAGAIPCLLSQRCHTIWKILTYSHHYCLSKTWSYRIGLKHRRSYGGLFEDYDINNAAKQ